MHSKGEHAERPQAGIQTLVLRLLVPLTKSDSNPTGLYGNNFALLHKYWAIVILRYHIVP